MCKLACHDFRVSVISCLMSYLQDVSKVLLICFGTQPFDQQVDFTTYMIQHLNQVIEAN